MNLEIGKKTVQFDFCNSNLLCSVRGDIRKFRFTTTGLNDTGSKLTTGYVVLTSAANNYSNISLLHHQLNMNKKN